MWRKGFLHCHFACREGVMDEFGISFHNPAVLAISEPQIQLRNPEKKMQGYCDMFQGIWMQVMVVDDKQVKEDSVNKHWNARAARPVYGRPGRWGHFSVGKEPLWCNEVDGARPDEARSHGGVQFCWERLSSIRNGSLDDSKYTLWRDCDFDTMSYYKDYILDFVWTVSRDHQTRQSRGRISCGRVRIDDSSWGGGFTRFKHRYQAEIDGCVNSLRAALEACPEGLWQAPWPAIAPETQFLVSRPEFLEKVVSWPPEKGIAGIEYRDFNRITQLVRGLENRLFHPDVIEVNRVWIAAHHMTRTEAMKAIKLKATEAQLSVLRACASRIGPVPPLDVDMACRLWPTWRLEFPATGRAEEG